MSSLPKVKQDRLFNIIRQVDSGPDRGRLEIFTAGFGAKLGSVTLEEISGWVAGSVIKLASFPKSVTGLANGTAGIARLVDSDGNIVRDDLSVGIEGSGTDIIVDSLTFSTGVAQQVVEGDISLDNLYEADSIVIKFLDAVTTDQTSDVFPMRRGQRQFQTKITGTGAVSATVKFYGSNDASDTVGLLLDTHTLTGTDSDQAYSEQPIWHEWPYVWCILSSISGTAAAVTATGSV